jgi:phenylpyruvate tautomerase PptA (4-oxalocrotonate tautomerase family)
MPILDLEIVLKPQEAIGREVAAALADRAAAIFDAPPQSTWVKVRLLDPGHYAENGQASAEAVFPVFVTVLKARLPSPEVMQNEVLGLTRAVAEICARPPENVHVIYAPAGLGRVAFGGKIVSG